jgi:formate dehydrogenase maturation protein FdhE
MSLGRELLDEKLLFESGIQMTEEAQSHCPTCGSTKRNEFWAWTPSFGGRWIPWFKCADEWHLARATQAAPRGRPEAVDTDDR